MINKRRNAVVAVVGDGACDSGTADTARMVGMLLARAGVTLVCGGLGGVMQAAAQGAAEVGGACIGLTPGLDRTEADPAMSLGLATGLGHMRNYLVVLNADAVIAVQGGWGTLSEIALARKIGRPVVAIGRFAGLSRALDLDGMETARSPGQAVSAVLAKLNSDKRARLRQEPL